MGSALVIWMLAAVPAYAGSGLIKITHSDTPYRGGFRTVPTTVAQDKSSVSQIKTAEVQVAVMARLTGQPATRRAVFIRR
jgi:hypothetical protein